MASVFLLAAHRWPVIMAFVLVGSLVASLAAYVWPAPYRAEAEAAITLDVYRVLDDRYLPAFGNVEFRNPDDFKHWQLTNLEVLSLSDEILAETVARLQQADPAWKPDNLVAFRSQLEFSWRNAGKVQLAVRHPEAEKARQAVEVWRQVVIEQVSAAAQSSRQIFVLDLEIQSLEAETRLFEAQLLAAESLQQDLPALTDSFRQQGAQPVARLERWNVAQRVAQAAGFDPLWQGIVESVPGEDATGEAFASWLAGVEVVLDSFVDIGQARLAEVEQQRQALSTRWEQSLALGRGVAPTLHIEQTQKQVDLTRARAIPLAALVGAMLGFLAWLFWALGWLSRREAA